MVQISCLPSETASGTKLRDKKIQQSVSACQLCKCCLVLPTPCGMLPSLALDFFPVRFRQIEGPVHCLIPLVLSLGALELIYLYGPPATTTFEYEEDNQCLAPPDEDDEPLTLVDEAIREHCDCVRDWMRGGVYFDPVATSYAAILVAIAFMLRRLVSPLRLLWSSIMNTMFRVSSSPIGRLLSMFHMLPKSSRDIVQPAIQKCFPDMPDIGSRVKEVGDSGDIEGVGSRDKWEVDFRAASKMCTELLINSRCDPRLGDTWATWKDEWKEASARLRDMLAKEPKNTVSSSRASETGDGENLEAEDNSVRKDSQENDEKKEETNSAGSAREGAKTSVSSTIGGGNTDRLKELGTVAETKEKAAPPANDDDTSVKAVVNAHRDEGQCDGLEKLASPEWVAWFQGKSAHETQALVATLERLLLDMGKEAHSAAEKDDAFVFFALQLTIGLVVLVDYFLVQEQPSGKSWMCRPAYVAGVMMYKPFTIPLWSCLTLCCHYTFVERLYGSYRRDLDSGTPYNSPLPRNKATLFMIGTVTLLQCAWAIGIAPLMFPLIAVFLPVVPLPAFILPLASIFAVQRALNFVTPKLEMCFEEKALEAVKRDAHKMKALAPWHRGSESFLRSAVSLNGLALEFVSDESKRNLGDDREVVGKFVQRNGMALKFASGSLKGDVEIAMLATSQNGLALGFGSEELRNNRDIVLTAVQQNGLALKHASEEMRKDTEIVLLAMSQNRFSLHYADFDKFRYENNNLKACLESLKEFRGSPLEFLEKAKEDLDLAEAAGHAQKRLTQAQSSWQQEQILVPPPIEESVLLLKASATILVSVGVVPLVLLPFYEHGFSWWTQGARLFVHTSFDLPRLSLQFGFAFRFPNFEQPRLAVQLAFGVILVVLQLSVRLGKWCLWAFAPEFRVVNAKPGVIETFTFASLSEVSWKPFRSPLELSQGVVEAVRMRWPDVVHHVGTYLKKREYGEKLVGCLSNALVGAGAISGVFPLYVAATTPSRQKTFSPEQGDVEVEDFCASEDSTSFNKFMCRGNMHVSSSALVTASMRSGPWLLALDFSNSPNLSGDIKCFKFLARIKSLKVPGCKLITGDIGVLVNCPHLIDLTFTNSQQISGSFEVFASLSALQELKVGNTSIDCSSALELISWASWNLQIKELDLSQTNVRGDISLLNKCTNLQVTGFGGCSNITGDIAVLSNFTNLVTANFKFCGNIAGDIAAFGYCANLKHADFSSCPEITGDIAALKKCTNLLTANFWDCGNISGDIASLGNCTNLVNVSFKCCSDITGDIAALGRCTHLENADFWDCGNITGDIAALGNCTNLVIADFRYCQNITDDNEATKRALPNCKFYLSGVISKSTKVASEPQLD